MMKALSLSQPWCWSIFDPVADKGIENRSWAPPIAMIGQVIAIHAAKSWDDKRAYTPPKDHCSTCRDGFGGYTPTGYLLHLGIDHAPARKERYPSSVIVGVATIDRIITEARTLVGLGRPSQKRWFFGPFGWVLTDRRALSRPIPCAGKQGLWTVPEEHEREILIQLREVN